MLRSERRRQSHRAHFRTPPLGPEAPTSPKSWDAFLRYVHEMRPFERDDQPYRDARAVAAFNAAGPVTREFKRLKPSAQSAICHVALCVVPRQVSRTCRIHRSRLMLTLAPFPCPTDAKAWRPNAQERGCRRGLWCLHQGRHPSAHLAPQEGRERDDSPSHERRDAEGKLIKRWTQTALAVSRVMQVWRSMVVRDRLLADDASVPFLQRQHFQIKDTGYARAAAASAGPKGVPAAAVGV